MRTFHIHQELLCHIRHISTVYLVIIISKVKIVAVVIKSGLKNLSVLQTVEECFGV